MSTDQSKSIPKSSPTSSPTLQNASDDYPQRWYDDGLEVVPPADPEVVPSLAPGAEEKIVVNGPPTPYIRDDKYLHEQSNTTTTTRPWWKKKRVWLTCLVVVLIIALGVGLGVGLTSNKGGNDSSSSSGSSGPGGSSLAPKCTGDLCARLLSSVIYAEQMLAIFASTTNGTVAFRPYNGSSWGDWQNLGEPEGGLISQPTALSWKVQGNISRIDLAVVSNDANSVYNKWYSDEEGWQPENDWRQTTSNISSYVSFCQISPTRIDGWARDLNDDAVRHGQAYFEDKDDAQGSGAAGNTSVFGGWSEDNGTWPGDSVKTNSAPAVVCRNEQTPHDIVTYTDDGRVSHVAYSGSWTPSQSFDGKFIGDPSLFTFANDTEHWDFFGVKDTKEMYHIGWSSEDSGGGYSGPNNLGGSILSMPSVISLRKDVLDVVALGTDGLLKHTHFDGSDWLASWEDLGIRAYSAPLVSVLGNEVFIHAVSQDGSLVAWSRDASVTETWRDSLGSDQNLGGELALDFVI